MLEIKYIITEIKNASSVDLTQRRKVYWHLVNKNLPNWNAKTKKKKKESEKHEWT